MRPEHAAIAENIVAAYSSMMNSAQEPSMDNVKSVNIYFWFLDEK